jgi:TetR/AcrR family transcriptional regulator, transcriptional repressor for nem operon
MGRRKEFDEETVVRAARDVFWERGYASTSLADLQSATGLSRSSLYETYGSKRGLFDRVARSYLDEIIGPLLEPMEADGAGRAEVVAYFRALSRFLRDSPRAIATRGCLMLNTAMELNILDADAVRLVRGYRERVRAAIHHALGEVVDAIADRNGKADVLTAGQMGLMTTSRIDPIQAAELAETIAADVASW